jgi:hypothetical protein
MTSPTTKRTREENKHQELKVAKHTLQWTVMGALLAIAAIVVAAVIAYVPFEPDLRYALPPPARDIETLEQKVDENGNWVIYCQVSSNFTNLSWRPGYIARVEVVPLSIATDLDGRVTHIVSDPIHHEEVKTVTIQFIVTISTDALNHLGTTRDLPVDVTFDLFDNTGKPVAHYVDGLFARM